jgi:hypothetical protein
MSDQRAIQLQQLANIVIDAYLNRHLRPKPDFAEHTIATFYFERPKGENVPVDLQVGYWYEKTDSDPENQQ